MRRYHVLLIILYILLTVKVSPNIYQLFFIDGLNKDLPPLDSLDGFLFFIWLLFILVLALFILANILKFILDTWGDWLNKKI